MDFKKEFQERLNHVENLHAKLDKTVIHDLGLDVVDLETTMKWQKQVPPLYIEIRINKKVGTVEDVSGIEPQDLLLYDNTCHVVADFDKYPELEKLVQNGPIPLMLFTFVDNNVESRYIVLIGLDGSFPREMDVSFFLALFHTIFMMVFAVKFLDQPPVSYAVFLLCSALGTCVLLHAKPVFVKALLSACVYWCLLIWYSFYYVCLEK